MKILHVPLVIVLIVVAGRAFNGNAQSETLTTLYSFSGRPDGTDPEAALVQGGDGNFYGTTEQGGTNDYGTVFQITSTGATP